MSRLVLSACVVLGLLGCAEDDTGKRLPSGEGDAAGPCVDTVAPSEGFLPCDVEAVFKASCQRCHNTLEALATCLADDSCVAGPFPLVAFADTRRVAFTNDEGDHPVYERMGEVVASGFMPFQLRSLQPPVSPLTDEQKKVILDWVEACAPSAEAACTP